MGPVRYTQAEEQAAREGRVGGQGLHAMSAQYMGTMVDRGKGGPGGLGISMALDKVLVWKGEACSLGLSELF